jgi:mono/diheme cytochrome c family protein
MKTPTTCFLSIATFIGLLVARAQSASSAQTPVEAAKSATSLFTAAQAARGEASYDHYCLACHGPHLDDGDFGGPPLRGSTFRSHWGAGDVAALFSFTKTVMPPDNPGGLSDATYAEVLAYILQVNGYKAGESELPTDPGAQAGLKLDSKSE